MSENLQRTAKPDSRFANNDNGMKLSLTKSRLLGAFVIVAALVAAIVSAATFGWSRKGSATGVSDDANDSSAVKKWTPMGQVIKGKSSCHGFGYSVAQSGRFMAAGSYLTGYDERSRNVSSYVRISEFVNGKWQRVGADIVSPTVNTQFGRSLSISANGTIVGIATEYENDELFWTSPLIVVYQYNVGEDQWVPMGQPIIDDMPIESASVALSADGTVLAVGLPLNYFNIGMNDQRDTVRVYVYNGDDWVQRGGDITGEAKVGIFGGSISLSSNGNMLAIGAKDVCTVNAKTEEERNCDNNGNYRRFLGYARIYAYNTKNGGWKQVGNDIKDHGVNDFVGRTIVLSSDGNVVAISSVKKGIRVFEQVAGEWIQLGNTISSNCTWFYGFGYSISMSSDGRALAIGSSDGMRNNASFLPIFTLIDDQWQQIDKLYNITETSFEEGFTASLSADGSVFAVGMPRKSYTVTDDSIDGCEGTGHVRVYRRNDPLG